MRPLQSSARESFAYFGDREGWLVFLGQHRDSDTIARSNFRSALKALGGEDEDAGIAVERFNHWAVGWTEAILIRPDAADKIAEAERIAAALEDYPVVDDDDLSELECDEANEAWTNSSLKDRLDYIAGTRVSIFAVRRNEIPQDDDGRIQDRLLGH